MKREDIYTALEDHFGRVKSKGNEIKVCCPFCVDRTPGTPDTEYHLWINSRLNAVHCFRCGFRSSVWSLLRDLGITASSARLGDLWERFASLREDEQDQAQEIGKYLHSALKFPEEYVALYPKPASIMGQRAWNYLTGKRGLTEEQIAQHGIGYAARGKYQFRILLPVFYKGELVYFTARSFLPAKHKYLNPKREECPFGKADVIFNLERAAETGRIVIAEGYFDCLALGDSGVCIFGKELSLHQLLLVKETGVCDILVCLDGEAWKEALEIAEQLDGAGMHPRVVFLPEGEDPAKLGSEVVKDFLVSRSVEFSWGLKMQLLMA